MPARGARNKIRKATVEDAKGIYQLINQFAGKKRDFLLPRPLTTIYENIRDFFVVSSQSGKVIGCVALHIVWEGLGEVKALAVSPKYQRQGVGGRLLEACLDEAIMMKLSKVFALTMRPNFFIKRGFRIIEREQLPHKIWNECINCHHFPDCDEVPVQIEL